MKISDLHPLLKAQVIPIPASSGCHAVLPLPTPQHISIAGCEGYYSAARSQMEALKQEAAHYKHADDLFRLLNRREAVDSSQIEGTHTGFDELLRFEVNLDTEDAETNPDASMTFAYVKSFDTAQAALREHGSAALNLELVKRLHAGLMINEPDKGPGEIRQVQNWIGISLQDARLVPPPPEYVPALLDELIPHFQPGDGLKQPSAFMRALITHAQFELIHPFIDGNGRTGRLLIPLIFAADDELPIHMATFLKVRQQEYYDALLEAQLRLNWAPWQQLFLECVASSCMHTVRLIRYLKTLRQEWDRKLAEMWQSEIAAGSRKRKPPSHAFVYALLDYLPGRPMLTVNQLINELGVTFPAANDAVEELVKAGILRLCKEQRRNRVFHAHEIMNALYAGLDDVLRESRSIIHAQ